ncbi:hypothetical protein SAMN04488006_2290 [Lutibacter maritimus]|uniref:Uncharacterized protein n=2 Tax=Lutibacter maritimus TaxID=593133 RepID=A0A1I6R6Y8_9FLAO|nr:hypothetical protein SAMN04488006_2290 [Lutibacter maritimus]
MFIDFFNWIVMKKTSHYNNYLYPIILLIFIVFLSGTMFGQMNPYEWNRLPTDSEINSAKQNLIKELTQTISVNGKVVDQKNVRLSPVIKFHNKRKAGQVPPQDISRMIVFVEVTGIMGSRLGEYNLFQSKQTGKFGFARHADVTPGMTLDEKYDDFIAYLNLYPNNDSGLARGFAPALGGTTTSVNNNTKADENIPNEDDEIPWEIVIGGSIAAAVAAIIRKILKKGAASKTSKSAKNKKEQKEEEEEAHYILQLNKNSFQLKLNEPETIEVQVWKVTAKGEKRCSANIQIQNFEKALKITPTTGVNSLQAQLVLEKQPKETSFTILVNANAEGHEFQKEVTIQPFGELQIVVETSPDNKRTLRPDTFQIITCYAQVLDELGKNIPDLTEKIKFTPKSDWVDISQSIIDGDRIAINIGCTNPNPISAASHPPKSVILSVTMDDVPDDVEPLQLDVEIQLLDCNLETEINDATFPATDEINEITFNAYIENAGEEIGWNFVGEYKIGDEPTDPLTTISIDKKNETEVNVKLSGPLIKPSENETFITKTLVISAFQNDEKPLERHLNIIVSREGLFIKHGVNKNNELNFTADKPFEQNLEFALNVYDENTNQIVVDKVNLQNLEFEFLNDEKEIQNLVTVLLPKIEYVDLVTNIPYGRYHFSTNAEIPGVGNILPIKYKVKAHVANAKKPEIFETILTVNVKTYGIGKEFPDWVKAYEECKYVINTYVPAGEPYQKLNALLESRKMTLGAEGMIELRNRIWKIASNLILAEGAEGYKSVDAWASAIVTTLEWAEWAGDIAFSVLMAYTTGGLGATAGGMIKGGLIDALRFYIYEPDKTFDDFWKMQTDKFVPMLMNMAKGRLLSIENIELIVKGNKPLAWTIFVSCEFLYNLYQTKSVTEAAKMTAQAMVEEVMIQKLTAKLHQEAMNRKIAYKSPKEVFDDIMKNTKVENDELVIDQKKLLELMRDPEAVRTIKNHGSPKIKSLFEKSRNKIYQEHDFHLKQYIKDTYKIPPEDIIIDDFRTPGSDATNVNTDRDYRVLRKVTKADGSVQYIELQRTNWIDKSYDIFGNITGKPNGIDSVEWAEKHQQRGTDRFDAEACSDYSDHTYNKQTGEVEVLDSNIKRVKEGKSTLVNAEEMGEMYKTKVENAVKNGTIPEAYAQLQKSIKTLENVREGYKNQNLEIPELDSKLKIAMGYAKSVKTDVSDIKNPMNVKNMEKQIKNMSGYDLKKLTNDINKSFKDLKIHDKGSPK